MKKVRLIQSSRLFVWEITTLAADHLSSVCQILMGQPIIDTVASGSVHGSWEAPFTVHLAEHALGRIAQYR